MVKKRKIKKNKKIEKNIKNNEICNCGHWGFLSTSGYNYCIKCGKPTNRGIW